MCGCKDIGVVCIRVLQENKVTQFYFIFVLLILHSKRTQVVLNYLSFRII